MIQCQVTKTGQDRAGGEKEEDLKPNGEERPGREEADKSKNHGKKYDLEERTARFGESIIDFVKTLPNT